MQGVSQAGAQGDHVQNRRVQAVPDEGPEAGEVAEADKSQDGRSGHWIDLLMKDIIGE